MSLPTTSKTWQFSPNNQLVATGTTLTDLQNLMLKIKLLLLAFGTQPWVVVASCNGAGGGGSFDNAGGDKWGSTNTNLVWAANGVAHSWIVLKQTGIASTFQICIDLTSSQSQAVISFSPGGNFSGGSATNAPTATDEVFLLGTSHAAPAAWISGVSSDFSAVLNVAQSTDGQCTRLWVNIANVTVLFAAFDKAANAVTGSPGWATPCWGIWFTSSATIPLLSDLCATSSPKAKGRANSVVMTLWLTSEGYNSSTFPVGQRIVAPSDLTQEYPLSPIGLASETTSAKGRHGTVQDLWWGSTQVGNADCYPATDVSRTFVTIGNLVHPWNGSIPLLS